MVLILEYNFNFTHARLKWMNTTPTVPRVIATRLNYSYRVKRKYG